MTKKDRELVLTDKWKCFYRSYYWGKKLLKNKGGKKLGIGESLHMTRWWNSVFFIPIKNLDTNWERFTRYSKSFLPPVQSFLPHMLMRLVFRKERKIVDGRMDKDLIEKMCQKKIRRFGETKCSHFWTKYDPSLEHSFWRRPSEKKL